VPPHGSLKKTILAPLRIPGMAEALSSVLGTVASIFMMHRFSSPEDGVDGHNPAKVRAVLSHLRKQGYDLMPLQEMFRRLRSGEPLRRAIAFTIDDGYFDQASIAASIFAELDCPVTIFVTTGFLDGKNWLWWDQIQYACEKTAKRQLTVCLGREQRPLTLESMLARRRAAREINLWCQDVSNADRVATLTNLLGDAEVELPVVPPRRFAPLSWEEARQLEKRGVTFGPHTVTHPILSSTSDEHAKFEISTSWNRVCDELASPVPIFCYPHGRIRDFGPRETTEVRHLGLWGGVQGVPGRFHPDDFREAPAICAVPRFPFSDNLTDVLQCVSGLERVKAWLRGARG
jgi:peptidoglycan/xylan/chitin deacetylase (PgdA/CDA1 family)